MPFSFQNIQCLFQIHAWGKKKNQTIEVNEGIYKDTYKEKHETSSPILSQT